MTREEREDAINCFKNKLENEVYGAKYNKLAIEALKQEPILDKIREEIEQEIIPRNSDQYDHEAMWQNLGLRMALKVIDKHKAESEDKND